MICGNQSGNLTANNACPSWDLNKHLSAEKRQLAEQKRQVQDWVVKDFMFDFFVTIEPQYASPMCDWEIRQRLRIVDYQLCKRFQSSKFSKYKDEDRFWYVGFWHGKRFSKERHTHFCLHVPFHKFKKDAVVEGKERELVKSYFLLEWVNLESYFPVGDKHNPRLIKKRVPIPHFRDLRKKKESNSGAVYASREIEEVEQLEDFYFSRQ